MISNNTDITPKPPMMRNATVNFIWNSQRVGQQSPSTASMQLFGIGMDKTQLL
jgi:hypothetical protein